ncbi:MAG TPA: coniferyl aldehyde dehydrogenase, partial [Rhodanobacter sp.]|nr:coniferyl aldehyde dehydrogenase [Rhodanobacter sp.]
MGGASTGHTADDLQATLQRLRNAQAREPMPTWATRARRLRALAAMLQDQRSAFVAAINADFSCRPREETELLEIFPSLSSLRHALRHGRRWMRPRRRAADFVFLPAHVELRP